MSSVSDLASKSGALERFIDSICLTYPFVVKETSEQEFVLQDWLTAEVIQDIKDLSSKYTTDRYISLLSLPELIRKGLISTFLSNFVGNWENFEGFRELAEDAIRVWGAIETTLYEDTPTRTTFHFLAKCIQDTNAKNLLHGMLGDACLAAVAHLKLNKIEPGT